MTEKNEYDGLIQNSEEHGSGVVKIAAGILLTLLGAFGIAKSKNIKKRPLRILITLASVVCIYSGVWLTVLGFEDIAIGRVGTYKIGQSQNTIQTLEYKDKADFEKGIELALANQPRLRRLRFKCPDQSYSFTIFNTPAGVMNVPGKDFVCADGFKLLKYANK